MKKKVVPKLRQEVKVDIVTSDDIKLYYTGKFQDFTARYIINENNQSSFESCQFARTAQADMGCYFLQMHKVLVLDSMRYLITFIK